MGKDLHITLEPAIEHDGFILLSNDLCRALKVHKTKCVGMTAHLEDAIPTFVHIFWDQAIGTFAFVRVPMEEFDKYPCATAHYLRDRKRVMLYSYAPNVAQICYRLGIPFDEGPIRIPITTELRKVGDKTQKVYIFGVPGTV